MIKKILVSLLIIVGFITVHFVGITYGTHTIPLHQSYVGDEQSPINGALHVLKEKNIFALRNQPNLYYGPLFSMIALPAVVADAGLLYLSGDITDAESYKAHILYDWGGIIMWSRIIATLCGLIGLFIVYKIFSEPTYGSRKYIPIAAALIVATNYYVFEYTHFFKHWVFVSTLTLVQLWALIKIIHTDQRSPRYYYLISWVATVMSFGISYLSVIYQIMWLPVVVWWVYTRSWRSLKQFLLYVVSVGVGACAVVAWHPYAFVRLLQGNAFIVMTQEISSWGYYAKLLILNHLGLIIAGCTVAYVYIRHALYRQNRAEGITLLAVLTVACVNFIVFGIQVRAEGRYMLITILFLVIALFMLYCLCCKYGKISSVVRAIVVSCIGITALVHIVHIGVWNIIYAQGHPEEQFIHYLEQTVSESDKVLVVSDYLLGVAHTPDAYRAYMSATNKGDVNLYNELLRYSSSTQQKKLPLYYHFPDDIYQDKKDLYEYLLHPDIDIHKISPEFTHVFVERVARIEPNQFDYFDEDMTRIWFFNDLFISFDQLR